MQLVQGLTQQEVRARQGRGESNAASFRSSRSYWDIIRANLFNFFNNILFAIGIALIALGQYNDAFTSVGQGLVNALIGTVQEINAKRKLDKIALLTRESKCHSRRPTAGDRPGRAGQGRCRPRSGWRPDCGRRSRGRRWPPRDV